MTASAVLVDVHPNVLDVIAAAALTTQKRETGGLLLGWWDSDRIVVRGAVEVLDPAATTHTWSRHERQAQVVLDDALAEHQHPWLGYIGDWHSHPAASGPSSQDVASICGASHQYNEPLVLLVHRAGGTLDHVVAHQGHTRSAVITSPPRTDNKPDGFS